MPGSIRRLAPLLVALLSLSGCHDTSGPERSGPLSVLERPVSTDHDTVDTQLAGALLLAVNDSAGRPVPHVAVSVRAVLADTTTVAGTALYAGFPDYFGSPQIQWQALVASNYAFPLWVATDSLGGLRLLIRLGGVAGRVGVRLAVVGQEATSTYTVWFTVRPGAPTRVQILPHDTAVYVDHTYQLRAQVVDRYGNARGEQPTAAGDSISATVTSAGLVTGRAFGRARLRAAWGAFADTAWASVVPRGMLAAVASYPSRVILVNLDGSEYHATEKSVGYIVWSPSGAQMAIQDNGGATPYCYYEGFAAVLDMLGNERQLLQVGDCSNFMEAQRTPRFSHDESWVFFERARYASGAGSFGSTIYRIHPDGTGLEAFVARGDTAALGGIRPLPSPSGRYLAYSVYIPPNIEFRVLDNLTGQTTILTGIANFIWMQNSDTLVAKRSSGWPALVLLRPDGSEVRSVPSSVPEFGFLLYDVSPDGQWVVIQRAGFELVNLQSGLQLPLAFTAGMGSPAWRP